MGGANMRAKFYAYFCEDGRTIEVAAGVYKDGQYGDNVIDVSPGETYRGKTYEQWKALIGKPPVELEY
jgi:hypothetical protein